MLLILWSKFGKRYWLKEDFVAFRIIFSLAHIRVHWVTENMVTILGVRL
jgi:hypothetical protein